MDQPTKSFALSEGDLNKTVDHPVGHDTLTRNLSSVPPSAGLELPGYEIQGELGRGGMGTVYKALQLALNRTVAIKLLSRSDESPVRLLRFRQEAEAVAKLQHPNITQIFEVGVHDLQSYLVLEYVDGGTLQAKTAGVPQAPREAAQLLETVARAVHHAHEKRIIHRDLKPANILITSNGVPKIADFGLARSMDTGSGLTKTSDFLGTPVYSSPEQVRGKSDEIGPATDVYALGVILYEQIAGRLPLVGENAAATLHLVLDTEPVLLRSLRPECPIDLETIAQKCLSKQASERYASAAALADDLRRYLAGEPILARPVSSAERAWRLAKRNPAIATLLAMVLFVFAAGAGGSLFYAQRADQKATEVQENLRQLGVAGLELQKQVDRANSAERATRLREAEALLASARGTRIGKRAGQRFEALAAIKRAAEIGRELG